MVGIGPKTGVGSLVEERSPKTMLIRGSPRDCLSCRARRAPRAGPVRRATAARPNAASGALAATAGALTCFHQAVFGLRWFRDNRDVAALARNHGISRSTCYRYANGGYDGARIGVSTPAKQPTDGHELDVDTRTYNALLRGLRCLGERGFALLTGRWRALRHTTTSPRKIGARGIRGMPERALLIGADLTIGPSQTGGTEVRLAVPQRNRGRRTQPGGSQKKDQQRRGLPASLLQG
jgi:hypothetical protein